MRLLDSIVIIVVAGIATLLAISADWRGSSPGSPAAPTVSAAPAAADSAGRDWRYIIIHHSATEAGSAAAFDRFHRTRGWGGLAYHFVIDNGRGAPDGLLEVGARWKKQQAGAHTGGQGGLYNAHGIGICLVGNFMTQRPTRAQLRSMETLVTKLMTEHDIPASRVMGHRDAKGASTLCPGRFLSESITRTYHSPTVVTRE